MNTDELENINLNENTFEEYDDNEDEYDAEVEEKVMRMM